MTLRRDPLVILLAAFLSAVPGAAGAQSVVKYTGLFTPYIGVTTGDDAEDPGFTFGASLAVIEANGWGAEIDLAHAITVGDEGFDDSGLTSGMLHLLFVWPRGVVRPFGIAGGGLLRLSGIRQAGGGTSRSDWGLSFGGGVQVPVTELLSIRGDVRYQRFLERHPDVLSGTSVFGAWRLAAGLTLNWPLEP